MIDFLRCKSRGIFIRRWLWKMLWTSSNKTLLKRSTSYPNHLKPGWLCRIPKLRLWLKTLSSMGQLKVKVALPVSKKKRNRLSRKSLLNCSRHTSLTTQWRWLPQLMGTLKTQNSSCDRSWRNSLERTSFRIKSNWCRSHTQRSLKIVKSSLAVGLITLKLEIDHRMIFTTAWLSFLKEWGVLSRQTSMMSMQRL